jgi:two-component system cell cycle response regulator PopA
MGRSFSILLVDAGEPGAAEAWGGLSNLGFQVERVDAAVLSPSSIGHVDAIVAFGRVNTPLAFACPVLTVSAEPLLDRPSLQSPAHPIQIAARLRALIRLSVLESVARLRAEDAHDAGAPPAPAPPDTDPSQVLYVGTPGPSFMRLQHALGGAEVETVAAFTTFTAFDYMHERAFDAVILSADPGPDMAHTVCSAMRRNTRLYHTPAILFTRGDAYAEADEAFARGASDIVSDALDPDQLSHRITALSAERRRRRRAKALLEASRGAALLDQSSDLFAPQFGQRHLESLLQSASRQHKQLSLIGLTASAPVEAGTGSVAAALDQFAAMLRHCVRAEDMAMRTAADQFVIALPQTPAELADVVAARVCAIAECTAYESDQPSAPFRLSLNANVMEPQPGMTAEAVIASALSHAQALRPQALGA